MSTDNITVRRGDLFGKIGLSSLGATALLIMTTLGVHATPSNSAVGQTLSASPMHTGETAKPTAAPKEPQTPKAVPGITGPAHLPPEQESARD